MVNLGVIGKPSDWLISSNVNYSKAKEIFNINLIDIGINEVKDLYNKVDVDLNLLNKFKNLFSENELVKALKIYEALKIIVNKYKLKGLTIRCFDLLEPIKSTACLALGLLNDEGIIGTCEGDVPALISMFLIKNLADSESFQANPSKIMVENNEIILAHCTIPLKMCTSFRLDTHFESRIGVAIKGELLPQKIGILRIASTLDKYVILTGEIVKNLNQTNLCRTQILVKLDNNSNVKYFLTKPLGNHHIIFYSNSEKLGKLNTYLSSKLNRIRTL